MTDDALRAAWIGTQPANKETLMTAMNTVLDEYQSAEAKERRFRLASVLAEALLFPALLWCAAYGKTPLVRGGYALMAVGTATILFAVWMHRAWSRQALPGPTDARCQLQKTGFLLARQAHLSRMAPLWCAPVFIGGMLIGAWLFSERSHSGGYLLWVTIAAAWLMSAVGGVAKGKKLDTLRSRMEQVLSDLG
jgi:hypothetical protein